MQVLFCQAIFYFPNDIFPFLTQAYNEVKIPMQIDIIYNITNSALV